MNTTKAPPHDDVTCAILAGGRGSRMDGRDKGLVELAGRAMIEHVIERVRPQVGGIVINANRRLDEYRRYGFPVVSDAHDDFHDDFRDDFRGPLAGMSAALRDFRGDWIMTVPCDSPLLPLDLAVRLYRAVETHGADVAVADDGQRLHPVFCLLSRRVAADLEDFLASGGRKIDRWFDRVNTVRADFSDEAECFRNVNTIVELAEIEQALREQTTANNPRRTNPVNEPRQRTLSGR